MNAVRIPFYRLDENKEPVAVLLDGTAGRRTPSRRL